MGLAGSFAASGTTLAPFRPVCQALLVTTREAKSTRAMMVGFLFGDRMNDTYLKVCSRAGCGKDAIRFIGKFGETRTTGSPVTSLPGIPIRISYCAAHEEGAKDFLDAL